jgi:hypothetical protein
LTEQEPILVLYFANDANRAEELPPKVKVTSLYINPKVTDPERLYDVKLTKIQAIENLTNGHL